MRNTEIGLETLEKYRTSTRLLLHFDTTVSNMNNTSYIGKGMSYRITKIRDGLLEFYLVRYRNPFILKIPFLITQESLTNTVSLVGPLYYRWRS